MRQGHASFEKKMAIAIFSKNLRLRLTKENDGA